MLTLAAAAILLTEALIVDGTGATPFRGELLVRDGRIVAIGPVGSLPRDGARVESLGGLALAPGFVDLHNHTELAPAEPDADLVTQLAQGITTVLIGLDGRAPWPLGDFLARSERARPQLNLAVLLGHHTLREAAVGNDGRPLTEAEVARLAALVEVGMREGAFGLSTGLEYPPGMFATTQELVALSRVVAAHGGIYVTHLRDEAAGMSQALEEALRIGREAGLPVHVSHIKRSHPKDWGQAPATLARLREARAQGIDVTADAYPYTAWHSGIDALVLSGRYQDEAAVRAGLEGAGGPERLTITRAPDPALRGLTFAAAARRLGVTPERLYGRFMAEGGADVIGDSMSPEDVDAFVTDPLVSISSDGGAGASLWGMDDDAFTHPRTAGTYPKVLREYVRERSRLSLQEAVRKMTSLPADRLGLTERGRLVPGARADLVAFDPERVRDRATYAEPLLLPEGIERVWVNGELTYAAGRVTAARAGAVLRRGRP